MKFLLKTIFTFNQQAIADASIFDVRVTADLFKFDYISILIQ